MKVQLAWLIFISVALVKGFHLTPSEIQNFPNYHFFGDIFVEPFEVELFQHQTIDWQQVAPFWDFFQSEPHRYMSYIAPPSSLVSYLPARPGSGITPNVYLNGQGYNTNRYVAPSVVKKLLAINPR
ncbi:uncharacterized protein LOC129777627 [Toxorhynchites rutilus septentrionalis]|uniref:uncharacterized protein LOC129777627 n=1 Tax=Toxorhynchites rutilus septentrionalis TaxID=329112 RepID=UPI00247A0337|nr:uncharacterized protein LOC129777627 [Toxorhynchites rutilus septentrionalis]